MFTTDFCKGVKVYRILSVEDVVDVCKIHGFYTQGSSEDFEYMKDYVEQCNKGEYGISDMQLAVLAKDIYDHNDSGIHYAIENIMAILFCRTVTSFRLVFSEED